ncbi:hypothetical protein COT87_01225 [Candidatus Collierbacteria bacterium CG10_big_fil_rev_8_21_14_0_10_44_9]|uniref:DUF3048 domain-containing protein n=1 Tax=Candidatus Collierbacteria bacterium CG10_big_fil_rev_8_21_14_0_10_44_9 TaxID=1974535 RepID=A0A2H0VJ44_9BACT|nr:MAG: hypothetical protein COT87_01225 [Candidatus Collierbacteria bacterium CG10_big_fil_rev_8_21_14_0_10_44_9]
MKNSLFKFSLIFFLAFSLSTSASYALTTYLYTPQPGDTLTPFTTPSIGGGLNIDPYAPRNSECPINGAMHTTAEQKVWESRRPLFVMIENMPEARPQSGLNSADVLYEAVVEGGVSRFGAVYYCGVAAHDTIIGPVRSARTHFVNLASEYNYPLYTHVGGANCGSSDPKTCNTDKRVQALEQINTYGWGGAKGNDLNQFSIGFPTFWRDYERLGKTVATEHTMYSSTEKLWKYAVGTRGWTNKTPDGKSDWKEKYVPFTFKDDAKDHGTVSKISFGFWESYHQFDVVWTYDSTNHSYTRENGGETHKDINDDSQLTAKVIVVQFTKELGPLDEHKHMFYEVMGTGKGIVFQDGTAVEAVWSKKDRAAKTIWTNAKGKKIAFNRGKIVFEILPLDNTVTY